jgi:CDP-glucose 4,6-dehydratase
MNHKFYSWKTILVTGSTGFKWSWLCLWLHSLGANVIGYSLPSNTEPNLFSILWLEDQITQIYADINDLSKLREVCDSHKPEIVFHLAAQPLVRESYRDPVWTFQTNVMGTVNVLEVIRKTASIRWAVLITTDKVYENLESMRPYLESDRLGWHDPYSTSKAMDELAITSYVRSFFSHGEKKIVSVRAGNVIGGGDWSADRLIPDIIRAFEQWEPVILRNPDSVRPWQHVLEPLSGYLMMGEKIFIDDTYLGAYNFGPDISDTMRVEDIVQKAISILGKGEYLIQKDETMHEAWLLLLDNTKSKNLLGWSPRFDVDEALSHTFEWYRAYADGEDMRAYSLEQIEKFILTNYCH